MKPTASFASKPSMNEMPRIRLINQPPKAMPLPIDADDGERAARAPQGEETPARLEDGGEGEEDRQLLDLAVRADDGGVHEPGADGRRSCGAERRTGDGVSCHGSLPYSK